MDRIVTKIETFIDGQVTAFEAAPLRTSLKLLVIYWILKKVVEETRS